MEKGKQMNWQLELNDDAISMLDAMKQKINDLEEVIEEYGQEKLLEPSLKSVLIQARTALEDCVGRTAKDEIYRQAALNNLISYMKRK